MGEIAPDLERILAQYNQSTWDGHPLTKAEHYRLMTHGDDAVAQAMKEFQVHSNALAQCSSNIFEQLGYSEPEALRDKIFGMTMPNVSLSALEIPAIIYP